MTSIGFFDLETTGKSTVNDRIVQISIIKTDLNLEIIEKSTLLLNPEMIIPEDATKIHGITNQMVEFSPTFKSYSDRFFKYFNSFDYIGGYNIKTYDIPLLSEEFGRCNLVWIPKPAIDPCVIFKKKEGRDLSSASIFYCGKKLEGAHDAENDVIATIDVLRGQTFRYGFDSVYEKENSVFCKPMEDVWVKESCYDNEDKRLDFAGKIIINNENIAVWNFGKYYGKNFPVIKDIPYAGWVLGSPDFSFNTKNVLRSLLP